MRQREASRLARAPGVEKGQIVGFSDLCSWLPLTKGQACHILALTSVLTTAGVLQMGKPRSQMSGFQVMRSLSTCASLLHPTAPTSGSRLGSHSLSALAFASACLARQGGLKTQAPREAIFSFLSWQMTGKTARCFGERLLQQSC